MDTSSYIKVSADTIRRACKKAKESENEQRKQLLEEAIKEKMSGWFFPCKTREAAIDSLKRSRPMVVFNYYDIIMASSDLEEFSDRMLVMCDKAENGLIFISDYHFGCLKDFMGD